MNKTFKIYNNFLFGLGLLASTIFGHSLFAQETNSQVSGKIISDKNEILPGSTVTAIHEPTKNIFITQSRSDGYFYFSNLKSGGPYTIAISYTGYEKLTKTNLFFNFNYSNQFFTISNNEHIDFVLHEKKDTLRTVIINRKFFNKNKAGIETNITSERILSMPSISRNFQDFIRLLPQAKVTGDGVISLAGQNNRFNAFFIDGANSNDILGLAASGTNGGQTGSPPISMDAIEEIKVLLTPYNVQYGNFTGGSINAITRSGTNEIKGSAWYYFRNENLAGRSPQPIETIPGIFERPRLSQFFNQTAGAWISGPIIKNKLFYFTLIETQSELRPQPFSYSDYKGASNQQQLNALIELLRNQYHYDPGSFIETKDKLNATRVVMKFDWNLSSKNKFTLSYRYNFAERSSPRAASNNLRIGFQNNGFTLPSTTHSTSFEWKSFFNHDLNNRLLFTLNNQVEDRKWLGQPFPRVTIFDGNGSIVFGSDPASAVTIFNATDITLLEDFKFIKRQHAFTAGVELNYARLNDIFIPGYFGNYQFRNINEFVGGFSPIRFQRSFSLLDEPKGDNTQAGSKYSTLRLGIFINDEIRINTKLKLNMGLRLDRNALASAISEDKFFNDTAINIISNYYDLEGARSGQAMRPNWLLSPRAGFNYRFPGQNIIIRGGTGVFSGHIVNAWASNIYSNGIGSIDINPQQYGLNFIPDPYNQPTPQSLNIDFSNSKGERNLISKYFKFPTVLKTSVAVDKKTKNNWIFSIEGIFTKNIHEASFQNINILPPKNKSSLPDSRNIYSVNTLPPRIPLRPNGTNSYTEIYLLSNNHSQRGFSYSLSFIVDKQIKNFSFNSSYTYGRSDVLFEITGTNTPIGEQWRQTETVNGKNFTTLSNSDNDIRHRITAYLIKKFSYSKNKLATCVTLFYNGQSGSPYSYVYLGSLVNDNNFRSNFDLIYIPTIPELNAMTFVPDPQGTTYSPQQQKDFLNDFIDHDKYLQKHRGEFAERNGARLPFTHIIDLRIQQDFKIKIKNKETGFSITLDVFNITNMLNKNWGRTYFMANDNFPLIRFAGYANTTALTPQYQFTPIKGTPYSIQSSTLPGNSARWISQLGFRINFN